MSEHLTDDPSVERALRAGLEEFDLTEEDRSLLEHEGGEDGYAAESGPLPVVAVVGRPNVGKSTLVNRILGRREAVVEDVPGVTRDRVAYDADWAGRRFTLVDTGGWEIDATGIHLRVAEQAEVAVDLADVVMFVVDATVGATDDDEAVVKLLRRAGKPVVLVANKVDDQRTEADAAALWNLGLGQPWPVSALHGRGSGDVLDAVLEVLPPVSAKDSYQRGGPRRVALIGRPNVGKSSLLNKLAGENRVVVDNVAGTTRDPVDEFIELGGKTWRFVDTAGIRRRVHQTRGADFYASLRTQTALEKAEVAVVLIDAEQGSGVGRALQPVAPARRGAPLLPRGRARARAGPDPVGAPGQHLGPHRPQRREAGAGHRARTGVLGLPGADWAPQRVLRRDRRLPPAPGAWRKAAPHPVRHPGEHSPAAVRHLRLRVHRGGLPPLPRAAAARGVRLRGNADRGVRASAREAPPEVGRGARHTDFKQPYAVR